MASEGVILGQHRFLSFSLLLNLACGRVGGNVPVSTPSDSSPLIEFKGLWRSVHQSSQINYSQSI